MKVSICCRLDLIFHLNVENIKFWEAVQIEEEILQNPAEVALYLHFIARGLPAQKAVDFLKQAVHFPVSGLILPEHHKGQGAALRNRENIFLVHCAVLRSYGRAGKDNEENGVGTVAGWLTDSVQYIPVDKDAVTRL